jgi:hypothetical protein
MPFIDDQQFFDKYGLTPDLLAAFAAPGDALCYYSGSINEGRGSATSDVDIVILGDEPMIRERVQERGYRLVNSGRTAFLLEELQGAPVEVAIFLDADVRGILGRLADLDFRDPNVFLNARPLSSHLPNENVQSILHRLSVAKPLNAPERFRALRAELSQARLCLWQARIRVARLNHLYEDLSGRLEIGEPESAFFLAREALMSLCAIYTNYLGTSIDRSKWWKVAFDGVADRLPGTRDRLLGALYRDCTSSAARIALLDECLDLIDEFHAREGELQERLLQEMPC